MPSWKVRWKSSERAKSWITSARQARAAACSLIRFYSRLVALGRFAVRPGNPYASRLWTILRRLPNALARAGAEEGVRRRAAGALAIDLGLDPGDLGIEDIDALFQLSDAEELQVF